MKTSITGKRCCVPKVQLEVLDNSAAEEVPVLQVGASQVGIANLRTANSLLILRIHSSQWQIDNDEDNILAGALHVAKMLTLIIMILMLAP